MTQFDIKNGYLMKVHTNDAVLTIPETVESIAPSAIANLKTIKTIVLPDSLHELNKFAIVDCENLTTIDTYSVNDISRTGRMYSGAIMNCEKIETIKLPTAITGIEGNALLNNKSISSIKLSDRLEAISLKFLQQEKPLKILLPNSVQYIEPAPTKNSFILNNEFYKTQNGLLTRNGEIIHANGEKIVLTDSINKVSKWCLRNLDLEVSGTSKNIIFKDGAIIQENRISDYYGDTLVVDREIGAICEYPVHLKQLTIKSSVDLKELRGKVKTIIIEPNVELDEDAFSNLEIKHIVYGDIDINVSILNNVAKDLFVPQDSKTYYKVLTVLKFQNIEEDLLRFWLAYSEQYCYSMYKKLNRILIANMKRLIEECGEDVSELEAIETKLLGVI
jgi:hypothetical protein